MTPSEICEEILGQEKIEAVLGELSTHELRQVLKTGGVKAKPPGSFVNQSKKRAFWREKVVSTLNQGNDELASELLQSWLLNHRRQMLIDFLDLLGVKHRAGETEDSFLVKGSRDRAHDAAGKLSLRYDEAELSAYLNYISYQQQTDIFDGWRGDAVVESAESVSGV